MRRASLAGCTLWLAAAPSAAAQAPDVRDPDGRLRAPGAVAPGGRLVVSSTGLARPVRVEVLDGAGWRRAGRLIERSGQRVRVLAPDRPGVLRVRGRGADGALSPERTVNVRALRLAAVGDINFGDGPGTMISRYGAGYPWASVGPRLRRADLTFGNLECAVSLRGSPQEKQYVFRGHPSAMRAMRRLSGMDVVNLANNHAGDYGDRALLDTVRSARANDIVPVGAGASEAAAYRPQVVEALGLRVAFVGFSTILPFEFRATGSSPGTAWAFPARVREGVRRARREADVVIATFHWGNERETTESAAQRSLAALALDAGATAVIGAHPHVLQPIRRPPGRLIAYSLGNFVFSAASPGTQRTGILEVGLGAGRVLGAKLIPAEIRASRPILRGV